MIICPQCSYPQSDSFQIIADRPAKCERCSWSGKYEDLIAVQDNKFKDIRVFDELYKFLQREISRDVGTKLVQLGLIDKFDTTRSRMSEQEKKDLEFFTKLLVDYSRAGFEVLLKGILERDGAGS